MENGRAAEEAERLAALEARAKGNTRRIEELEQRLGELRPVVTAVATMDLRIARIEADVREIKSELRALCSRPANHWNRLLDAALGALAAGLVAFALVQLGVA
jgi:chromosome segregation ATPase